MPAVIPILSVCMSMYRFFVNCDVWARKSEGPACNEPNSRLVEPEQVFDEVAEVDTSVRDVEKGQSPPVAVWRACQPSILRVRAVSGRDTHN